MSYITLNDIKHLLCSLSLIAELLTVNGSQNVHSAL